MADEKTTATTAEKMPTAAEFAGAIDFVMKNKPEEWPAIVNSTIVAALKRAEELEKQVKILVFTLIKTGVIVVPSAQPAAASANGAPAAPGVPPGSGAPRKGSNGEDLTPQEAAIEEMMDSAPIDNSQPAPAIAGQGPAQRKGFAKPAAAAPAANGGGSQRVGGDGKPLSPQEAAIEDMMDEAPVVND